MGVIRKLSPSVVNQIAAGEVVERPASVVKELMENAIDAKARRVEVSVERGGKDLIRVADDGEGMAPDDLLLAFQPHATSKLVEADDLHNIRTLGFRGEALAAIDDLAISINLSANSLNDPLFWPFLKTTLQASRLPPEQVNRERPWLAGLQILFA